MIRNLVAGSALCIALLASQAQSAYNWKSVQIHGGGYVPGIAFHPKAGGPVYARTDVGGAYRLNPSNPKSWLPLNDGFTSGNDMGSIAIGLDPDDTNYVYLTGGLYLSVAWAGSGSFLRSADRGATWTKVVLSKTTVSGAVGKFTSKNDMCLGGNENTRGVGPRIAAKGTTIYLGTNQNGLLKSSDRGNTWTTVTALGDTGISAVIFDKDGNAYAAPYAGGIYKSTDGTAWTKLDGFTGKVMQMSYAKTTNKIWITSNASTKPFDMSEAGNGTVWTFDATAKTFAAISMPTKDGKDYGYAGISVNPSDNNEIAISTIGWWRGKDSPLKPETFVPHEAIFLTQDGGATWNDILGNGILDAASAYNSASSNPHWITGLAIDPANPRHVIFGTGYGVWSTLDATLAKPTWTFDDDGLEETVPLALVSSTVGAPLVSAVGDVDGYYHTNLDQVPSSRHQVEAGTNFDLSVAGQAPNKMIRIFKETKFGLGAYSEDAGKTWTSFATYPPFVASEWSATYTNESNFAAISADGASIVWNMQTNGVYFSKDKGATWTKSTTSASLLTSTIAGFRVVADRVAPGVFYIYNAQAGVLYRTLNSGETWTAIQSSLGKNDDWAWGYLRVFASPKAAGEIWITQGQQDPPAMWVGDNIVYRSTDSGKTITAVSTLKSATSIGFGKGLTATVPAIYIYGLDGNGTKGLFRSSDDAKTWTRIDDDTHRFGGFDRLAGDPCIYSRLYFSAGGARGVLYGQETGSVNTSCPSRSDFGNGTAIADRTRSFDGIRREGSLVRAGSDLSLTTLDGRVLRRSTAIDGRAELRLDGLRKGVYVAKSSEGSVKISLF